MVFQISEHLGELLAPDHQDDHEGDHQDEKRHLGASKGCLWAITAVIVFFMMPVFVFSNHAAGVWRELECCHAAAAEYLGMPRQWLEIAHHRGDGPSYAMVTRGSRGAVRSHKPSVSGLREPLLIGRFGSGRHTALVQQSTPPLKTKTRFRKTRG